MTAYVTPPVFDDNVGQLLSAADLDILRHNVHLAEGYTYRWSELLANSGGVETAYTVGHIESSTGDLDLAWDGYLMIKAGMTTLTVEGRTASIGSSTLKLYIDDVFKQSWTPGTSSWSITQSLSGYSVGQVVRVSIKVLNNGLSATGTIFIQDVYGSPISFTDPWPGTPTFTTAFSASQLNQLTNATSWVLNRSGVIPRPAFLATRYALGSCAGPDRRPILFGTVGRYDSSQDLRLGFQVINEAQTDGRPALPNLHCEVWINGSLAWDSGNIGAGTHNFDQWISLSGVTLGTRAEIAIYSNQQDTIPRNQYNFSRWTIWTCQAQPHSSSIYTTPATPPAAETLVTASSVVSYLNNLSSIVAAAKARIDNQPNFFGRVRAQRRFFSKYDKWNEPDMKRNPPRFWRCGEALVVNGKGVSLAYGPITIPTNDKGVAYGDYSWGKTQQIIDPESVGTQAVFLDAVNGLTRGVAYNLTGQVRWAEESLL